MNGERPYLFTIFDLLQGGTKIGERMTTFDPYIPTLFGECENKKQKNKKQKTKN